MAHMGQGSLVGVMLGVTLGCCLQESVPSEMMTFNMVVSVLWAAYNSIPPILLLHFAFAGHKGMRWNVRILSMLASLLLLGVIVCVWLLLPPTYDFGQVRPKAPYFLVVCYNTQNKKASIPMTCNKL